MILRNQLRPAFTLALITPFCTELLSGSTPPSRFFLPWIFALLVVLYGVPMLIIREIFVHWKLGLPGLCVLGLAYGIYNEGVVAKTLLRSENVPINAFNHYGVFGINWAWAALIVPWHALNATIFPIAIVTWMFPADRPLAWLSRTGFVLGSLLSIAIGVLFFLDRSHSTDSPGYLAFLFAVILVFIFLSRHVSRGDEFLGPGGKPVWYPVLAGVIFYPAFIIGLCFLASLKLPAGAIGLGSLLLIGSFYRLIIKYHWLPASLFVLLAFGNYLAGSLFHLLTSFGGKSLPGIVLAVAMCTTWLLAIIAVLRRN